MSRRRYLLDLVSNEKYREQLFNYVFYNLIPDTISGKTVKDKGKTKCVSIIGNGVVENQLVNTTDTSYTFNDTHKYLKVISGVASLYTGVVGTTISVSGGTDILIDLTLMYGTGNEPTSTTDNRIVALLNRGYIPYNTGTYKESVVQEIELEPYNMFDGVIENGYINPSTGISDSDSSFNHSNFIEVISGMSYTCEVDRATKTWTYVYQYDKNKAYIKETDVNKGSSITFDSNIAYIKLGWQSNTDNSSSTFHQTGTRTGYAPHINSSKITLPQSLSLGGAINSHNTLTITSTSYVFTRNVWKVDLGSLSYYGYSGGNFYSTSISDMATISVGEVPNAICNKYKTYASLPLGNATLAQQDKIITYTSSNHAIICRDSSYTDIETFKNAMSGVPLYYQLASPQTITIPKKHLGCVDLGSLSYFITNQSQGIFGTTGLQGLIVNSTSEMYCSKYKNANIYTDNECIFVESNGAFDIRSSDFIGKTTDEVRALLSGVYLWYETQNEVADFTNKAIFERGGTINTNEYSWIENQLLQNGNFVNTQVWSKSNASLTVNNNVGTLTSTSASGGRCRIYQQFIANVGDKLFVFATAKSSINGLVGNFNNDQIDNFTLTNNYSLVYRFIASTYQTVTLSFQSNSNQSSFVTGETIDIKNFQCVNLTLGFGAGNEPTSVNDWRIQDIINNGYIETNTTGTQAEQITRVLCDLNMKIQVK